MFARTSRRKSLSKTIDRNGSIDALGRCDGGSSAGFSGIGGLGVLPCKLARVGVGEAAGIMPGDERYADRSVICDSVKAETVARSWTWIRAQSRRAVS